jgi:hypothetical protein
VILLIHSDAINFYEFTKTVMVMLAQPDTQVSETFQSARQVVELQQSNLLKPMILIVDIFLRDRQFS